MKRFSILIIILGLFSYWIKAQEIVFSQNKLGECDSSSSIKMSSKLLPDTIQWDSLQWKINGAVSTVKNQSIQAKLGNNLELTYFYGNPVQNVKNSYVVVSTENIQLHQSLVNADRYTTGNLTVEITDTSYFKAGSWSVSSGSIISSDSKKVIIQGVGDITYNLKYNSGCQFSSSAFIAMEAKPELEIIQTQLVDPIGINGLVTGRLLDGSLIDSVNSTTINANSFNLSLGAGLQTINVYSGSFSWQKQIDMKSLNPPDYQINQLRLARWCDSSNAVIRFVAERGIIDSIELNKYILVSNNDTAYLAVNFGKSIFTIYNGQSVVNKSYMVDKNQSWENELYFDQLQSPKCSKSADGLAILSYPSIVDSIIIDTVTLAIQDSLKNLTAGVHQLIFIDNVGCRLNKTIEIPISTNACFEYSSAFSPNGDGINDVWRPIVPEGANVNLDIYTYRKLTMESDLVKHVFSGTSYWDGTDNLTGNTVKKGYYIIKGEIQYPAYMNMPNEIFRKVIKLVK